MADNPIPRTLETPPRTTGNMQYDMPILIDWFYRAYQVITQAVNYLNNTVNPAIVTVENLPDPNGTTLAQAQKTANDAYSLAIQNKGRLDGFISGTFTTTGDDIGVEVTFTTAQKDALYRVVVQPISIAGSPPVEAMMPKTKTYASDKFTVIMLGTPGDGNSVNFEWQLIRNS